MASKFGLKKSTLHDGLRTGQFRLGSGRQFSGRKPTFSLDEEKRIAARYYIYEESPQGAASGFRN